MKKHCANALPNVPSLVSAQHSLTDHSQPALPAITTAHLPAWNPDWLDWSSFIWGRWWWQVKCHYLRQTGNTVCAERFPWGSLHSSWSDRDLLNCDLLQEAALQRAALSSSFCSCLLFACNICTAPKFLMCVLLKSLQYVTNFLVWKLLCCPSTTIRTLRNLILKENVVWLLFFFFTRWACWETCRHPMHLLLNSAVDLGVGELQKSF